MFPFDELIRTASLRYPRRKFMCFCGGHNELSPSSKQTCRLIVAEQTSLQYNYPFLDFCFCVASLSSAQIIVFLRWSQRVVTILEANMSSHFFLANVTKYNYPFLDFCFCVASLSSAQI